MSTFKKCTPWFVTGCKYLSCNQSLELKVGLTITPSVSVLVYHLYRCRHPALCAQFARILSNLGSANTWLKHIQCVGGWLTLEMLYVARRYQTARTLWYMVYVYIYMYMYSCPVYIFMPQISMRYQFKDCCICVCVLALHADCSWCVIRIHLSSWNVYLALQKFSMHCM